MVLLVIFLLIPDDLYYYYYTLFLGGMVLMLLMYMVFVYFVVSGERRKNVFVNISCGEISDFLVLLDCIISGDVTVSSLPGRIDLWNVESCLVKLRDMSSGSVGWISDILNKYDVIGGLRRHLVEERRYLRLFVLLFF